MSFWDRYTAKGLAPGTYRYDGKGALAGHRFHLRVDSQMKGVLLVDASRLLFLNGTAIDLVRCVLDDMGEQKAASYMRGRYNGLKKDRAIADLHRTRDQVVEFAKGDVSAILHETPDTPTFGADDLPSPYRMDLALTYRCQNECGHCYNEDRQVEELPREKWVEVIDHLWEIGIPHIVFTGGEPTLVPFLRELIVRSEDNGQITGLITNGRKLRETGYLRDLVEVGLDHVQITVLSHRESVHDKLVGQEGAWKETVEGLKVALVEDLYVSTNTTIMAENLADIEETLRFLMGLGAKNIAFNGIIRSGKGKEAHAVSYDELKVLLSRVVAIAREDGVNLVWYTPTPYCELSPLELGLGIKQCTACSINMAIEPDGSVLPCQSYYESLGNILTERWPRIWDADLCRRIRNRQYMADRCSECLISDVCGGGCPLSLEHGDYVCLDRSSNV